MNNTVQNDKIHEWFDFYLTKGTLSSLDLNDMSKEFLQEFKTVEEALQFFREHNMVLPSVELDPEAKEVINKPFEAMTDAEKEQFLINHYLEITDNASAIDDLKAHIETIRQGYKEVWETGFKGLDDILDGGFIGKQLIFLGAVSSLGKTSLALQMATQISERGKDVLIFSLEMGKEELNAKTISRYTHIQTIGNDIEHKRLQAHRLTTRDIMSARIGEPGTEKRDVFEKALEATQKLNSHTYIIKKNYSDDLSVDDVKMWIEYHIKARKTRPFVIIDYLQILDPSEHTSFNDRRSLTDYDVRQLKGIAVDYNIPVLCISAFNRASYLDPVNMGSFRESSGIEYSSDILLGMQYKGMEYKKHGFTDVDTGKFKEVYENEKDHNTRVRELVEQNEKKGANGEAQEIELKLLKNRNGAKGAINLLFTPKYNYYEDMGKQSTETNNEAFKLISDDENPWDDD